MVKSNDDASIFLVILIVETKDKNNVKLTLTFSGLCLKNLELLLYIKSAAQLWRIKMLQT